jgi:hypothetical protein
VSPQDEGPFLLTLHHAVQKHQQMLDQFVVASYGQLFEHPVLVFDL